MPVSRRDLPLRSKIEEGTGPGLNKADRLCPVMTAAKVESDASVFGSNLLLKSASRTHTPSGRTVRYNANLPSETTTCLQVQQFGLTSGELTALGVPDATRQRRTELHPGYGNTWIRRRRWRR